MPENETPVSGNEDPGTVIPAPAPSGQPAVPPAPVPDDWQKRFTGLQNTLNETLRRTGWTKLSDIPVAQEVTGWREAANGLAALQQAKTDLETDHEISLGELTGLRSQVAKLTLLAEKHPELMRFHSFIPTADTPEDQENAIAAFQGTLAGYAASLQNGAPMPPRSQAPAGGSATLEDQVKQAWTEYNQAVLDGKPRGEIQRLFETYNKIDADYRKERGITDKYAAPRARAVE